MSRPHPSLLMGHEPQSSCRRETLAMASTGPTGVLGNGVQSACFVVTVTIWLWGLTRYIWVRHPTTAPKLSTLPSIADFKNLLFAGRLHKLAADEPEWLEQGEHDVVDDLDQLFQQVACWLYRHSHSCYSWFSAVASHGVFAGRRVGSTLSCGPRPWSGDWPAKPWSW